ncbi:hypothetical protein FJT64_025007 [Amphibalanus amphitrite]|uniref:Uncharacterized protein n=1 Tax=Amphibalanus amphitrite TaxID=1232801 RepID=A0A6A4WL63_AMPAM|nr:hypothetical protein FJT64_025007 [Amphibalanus amphitrite]
MAPPRQVVALPFNPPADTRLAFNPPGQSVSLAFNPLLRVLTPAMAPRPNSGLETHEEEIIGDSPTLEPYLHHTNATTESQEKISIIVGIVVALLLAILIVIVCAAVIRRMRRRRLPASSEDGKGMRMKRVRRGKGVDEDEEDLPSPLDDLHDPYVQFVYIPPNRGLKLWKGRLKIMKRHLKRSLLKKQIEIHGCTIPEHCRAQLKRIYVY